MMGMDRSSNRSGEGDGIWPAPLLIADDFGLNTGCDAGITSLAQSGRLSGTSAMVNFPGWKESARHLRALRNDLAIGLHINLTEGSPLTAPSLPDGTQPTFQSMTALVLRSYTARVHQPSVTAEISAQIERFCDDVGAPPDFIDGHRHAHVLPVVRDAVLEAVNDSGLAPTVLLRWPGDSSRRIRARGLAATKSMLIAALAMRFRRDVRRHGILINDSFSGVTTLDDRADVAGEFQRALSIPGQRHLVMCHPAINSGDLLEARRQAEFDALRWWQELPQLIWHPVRDAEGRINWRHPAGAEHADAASA